MGEVRYVDFPLKQPVGPQPYPTELEIGPSCTSPDQQARINQAAEDLAELHLVCIRDLKAQIIGYSDIEQIKRDEKAILTGVSKTDEETVRDLAIKRVQERLKRQQP